MTKKGKLEAFDAMQLELNKLRLAVFDLAGGSRFPFRGRVTVDCGKEIDSDYQGHMYRVSVSERAMPVYMVESIGCDGQVSNVEFWHETEISDHRNDSGIYWRMLRHACWKLATKVFASLLTA